MAYRVMVIDNYGAPEEGASSGGPSFATADGALAYCKAIVDDFLRDNHRTGMSAAQLWEQYTLFGEDPVLLGQGTEQPLRFSGWDYARKQCDALCAAPAEMDRLLQEHYAQHPEAGYVIDCDYGGAWSWLYRPARDAFIGSNQSDGGTWSGQTPISKQLAQEFGAWQGRFECADLEGNQAGRDRFGDFSWSEFHVTGIALAKRLKQELGWRYVVIYSKTYEDKTQTDWNNLLIRMDGSVENYVHQPYWAPTARDDQGGKNEVSNR